MESTSWRVTILMAGKIFTGKVSIGGGLERRTIAVLNTSSKSIRYTGAAGLHLPEGFLLLEEAAIKTGTAQQTLGSVYIRKSEIILAYDEFESMGSELEKRRFEQGAAKAGSRQVTAMTINRAGYWYQLTGHINQLETRLAGKDLFIPMTSVRLERFSLKAGAQDVSQITLPFAALNSSFIESIQIGA
jgi:hypothetical protein